MIPRLLLILFLLFATLPASAQFGWLFGKSKKAEPAQSSLRPQESFVEHTLIPPVAKPLNHLGPGAVPNAWLGITVAQMIDLFPGVLLVDAGDERLTYRTTDSIFFEIYNNHVVATYGDIKGNWKYPSEAWFIQVMNRIEQSGFERRTSNEPVFKYYYKTFVVTVRYNKKTDFYRIRYEYLPSQYRYGELIPTEH